LTTAGADQDFLDGAERLAGLGVPAALFPGLRDLLGDVRAANEKLNLVADAGEDALFMHLADSLQALAHPAAARAEARIIDIGTGGGFPGLPLLAARPGWTGLLVDSVRKKAEAVGEIAARRLGGRAAVSWTRAETLAREAAHRGAYDLAFCRAVGRFTTVAELTLPFLKVGGALLAHRGHEAPSETAAAADALARLGGRAGDPFAYDLPGLDKKRYIVRIDKIAPTPDGYPRREGVPAKKPL
jgi:16S rRNA (guanine527-N7)-methyltransferase